MTKITRGISWEPETLERAKALAEGGNVSQIVNELVDAQYDRLHPEPPIETTCPSCNQETTFLFVAYWPSQSDLYRCDNCKTILQRDALIEKEVG